jgi:phage terminase small subunit
MAVKLTIKQEEFCLAYIETGNASEAYRRAYSCGRMKAETVKRNAFRLTDNSKIKSNF